MSYIAEPTYSDNAVDLLSKARTHYDKGRYDDALTAAERAKELNPESEAIAVVLSSIHMAKAGIDSFQLVERMILNNSGESLIATNAASNLSSLSSLLGISSSEFSNLTLENNEKDGVRGDPDTGLFKDLPVLLPKSAPDARATGGDTIYHIDQAIMALCPFVDESVKIIGEAGDIRHNSEECSSLNKQEYQGKSHFNWAFSHLTEAILFHSVVLYSPSGDEANLQKRADILDNTDEVQSTSEYIAALNELVVVTDIILPTSIEETESSMLLAMFNDLDAASRGLASLPGIPESITSGIIGSLEELKNQRSQIEGQSTGENDSSKALKGQLTESLSQEIGSQIKTKFETENLSDEEKEDICLAYDGISSESIDECEGL